MSSSQQKTLEDFIRLQNRNAVSHAIRAAVELGVIASLREGQRTVDQLASELQLDPAASARLMNVLAESELIDKYGEDYALSPIARLIPDRFLDFGDEHWRYLAAHIRSGEPLTTLEGVAITDLDYALQKSSEEWTLTPTALSAAQALDLGKSRSGLKILEVGCGSAVFGVTLAHADPASEVYLLDDEFGLDRARKTVESVGLEQQISYIEADPNLDLVTVPALEEQSFDLVLIVGQINRRDQLQCRALFGQLRSLVKSDAELALIDVFPGQEDGNAERLIFELELGLRTSHGQLHDPKWLKDELESAGFGQIQFAHLPSPPFYWGLVLAQRE